VHDWIIIQIKQNMFGAWSNHSTNKIKNVLVVDRIIIQIKLNIFGAWLNHSKNKIKNVWCMIESLYKIN